MGVKNSIYISCCGSSCWSRKYSTEPLHYRCSPTSCLRYDYRYKYDCLWLSNYQSYKSSDALLKKILDEKVKNCTLHSCIINLVKNEIVICREYNKTHLNMNNVVIVKPNEEKLWDYRFVVISKFKKLRLKKIDDENWKFVKEYFFSNCKRKLKAPIIKTLPLVKFESNYLIPFVSEKKEFLENGINFYFKNFI